jgi:hypothetical protein
LGLYTGLHLASWTDAVTRPLAWANICGIVNEKQIRNKNAKQKDITSMYTTHTKDDEDLQLHELILVMLH